MPHLTPEIKKKLRQIQRIDKARYRLKLRRKELQHEIAKIEASQGLWYEFADIDR